MKRTTPARRILATALATAALTLGAGLPAGPAAATQTGVDRPRFTENDYDLGEEWFTSGPRNGAHLYWDVTNDVVTIRLTGYMYINNQDGECAFITILYHDADGGFEGSQGSGDGCADGNRLNKFALDMRTPSDWVNTEIDHVHISLNHRLTFNTYEMLADGAYYND